MSGESLNNYESSYQFSGNRESMRVRDNVYYRSKIIGRKEKDKNQSYSSKEKVRILNDRKNIQKTFGRRLNNLI